MWYHKNRFGLHSYLLQGHLKLLKLITGFFAYGTMNDFIWNRLVLNKVSVDETGCWWAGSRWNEVSMKREIRICHLQITFILNYNCYLILFLGPLADKFGRRKLTLVFALLYGFCCLIKFSPNFWVLLSGRLLVRKWFTTFQNQIDRLMTFKIHGIIPT